MKINIETKFNIGDKVQSKYRKNLEGVIKEIQVKYNDGCMLIGYLLIKDNGLSLTMSENSIESIKK